MRISVSYLAGRVGIRRRVRSNRASDIQGSLSRGKGAGPRLQYGLRLPARWLHGLAASIAIVSLVACSDDTVSDPNDPTLVGVIAGTVKDSARIPLTGMRVSVVAGTTQFPEIGVVTDLDGQFVIGGLLPGTFDLGVFDKGGRRLAVASVRVRRGEVSRPNIVLGIRGPVVARVEGEAGEEEVPTAGSIEGVITDPNEDPVPGLTVRITDGSTDYPDAPVVTDSAGSYRIAPVPLGTFQISVQEPDGKRVGIGLAKVTSEQPVVRLHFRAKGADGSSGVVQAVDVNTCEGFVDPPPATLLLKTAGDTSAQAEDANILSRCTATVSTSEGSKAAVMTVEVFNSSEAAGGRYDALRTDLVTASAETSDDVLDARSFAVRRADGSHLVFQKGEHVVKVQTTLQDNQAPAGVPGDLAEYILGLARTAKSRLP